MVGETRKRVGKGANKNNILWTKLFKDSLLKDIVKDYASGVISADTMKKKIKEISPIMDAEVKKMNLIDEKILRQRAFCALNGSGTPVSGFTFDVDFYPYP